MRCRGDGGLVGCVGRRAGMERVRLIAAVDADDGVVHRDVQEGQVQEVFLRLLRDVAEQVVWAIRFHCPITAGLPSGALAAALPTSRPEDVRSVATAAAAIQARILEREWPRGDRDVDATVAMTFPSHVLVSRDGSGLGAREGGSGSRVVGPR